MLHNINVYVESDYETLSKKAAYFFSEVLKQYPTSSYGFATGSTPLGMYEAIKKMHESKLIDLSQITAFNLDEYFPISSDNPQSYQRYMAENLFDAVSLPLESRNIPRGDAENPKEEAKAFEEKIKASGGIELQILGIGHNGHIGFNEPGDSFSKQTDYIALDENTIQNNARFFDSSKDVPRHSITMGIHSIMMSKRILLLASGKSKAEIVRDALLGPITPSVPASILQVHRNVTVVIDSDAAQCL